MHNQIILPLRRANLLRRRVRSLVELNEALLAGKNGETVHDLRVASRRMRELLDALETTLPAEWYSTLKKRTKKITRTLGRLRETEVNLKILDRIASSAIVDSAIIEILSRSLRVTMVKRRREIEKELSAKAMKKYKIFLNSLHGSRFMSSDPSAILQERMSEFLNFSWDAKVDDHHLHDLRIRTKRLRYAIEIEKSLARRPQGRFLQNTKVLQTTLGELNDLYIFSQFVEKELEDWNTENFNAVPAGLQRIRDFVLQEKSKLYPLIYPRYARIVSSAPVKVAPIPAMASV